MPNAPGVRGATNNTQERLCNNTIIISGSTISYFKYTSIMIKDLQKLNKSQFVLKATNHLRYN